MSKLVFALAVICAGCSMPPVQVSVPPITVIPQPQEPALKPGRFQVVNASPSFAGYIMLLDSDTGETWIICGSAESGNHWCDMKRGGFEQGPRARR
jgi:hypothetical protein